MPKASRPPKPVPLYESFPTSSDRKNPVTGKTEPAPESVEEVREWGKQSKL